MNETAKSNIEDYSNDIETCLDNIKQSISDGLEGLYNAKIGDELTHYFEEAQKEVKEAIKCNEKLYRETSDIETECDECEQREYGEQESEYNNEFTSFEPIQWNATNMVDKEMMELLQSKIESGITPRKIIEALEKL